MWDLFEHLRDIRSCYFWAFEEGYNLLGHANLQMMES